MLNENFKDYANIYKDLIYINKMEFCPKCGAVIIQKKKNYGCPRCNYSLKGNAKITVSEKIDERKEIAVVSDKDNQTLPVVIKKCNKCNNDKAYFWLVQTRASDESETKFFKCTKCNNTRRDYR
jgi:DNA-directed RNA polymerase subunit M